MGATPTEGIRHSRKIRGENLFFLRCEQYAELAEMAYALVCQTDDRVDHTGSNPVLRILLTFQKEGVLICLFFNKIKKQPILHWFLCGNDKSTKIR